MIIHHFEQRKFSERVKLYLKVEEISLRKFTELTGVNYNTLHKLIHGQGIRAHHLIAVAYFLDIDLRDYVTEIDADTGVVQINKERQLTLFKGAL